MAELREYLRRQSEKDKANRVVHVEAASVEEGLRQASIELGVPVRQLEYEVLARGTKATFGIGGRPWRLSVYERIAEAAAGPAAAPAGEAGRQGAPPPVDAPGEAFVRIVGDGAFLKVTKARGRGARATEAMALERLSLRGIAGFDPGLVSRVVRHADEEWVRVADVKYNQANDATVTLDFTDGEMKAAILATEPGPGGADLTADWLRGYLQSTGVVHGIKEEALSAFEQEPRYGKSIVVAEGTRARDGADARIEYLFARTREPVKLREKDGRIDFKDVSRIENVVLGQVLARKHPAEQGQTGMTVTGTVIPAQNGKDCELPIGKNVRLAEDGLTALAEINGQVLLLAGKITVEPVYVIPGDVNLHTGNVLFLGTVIVRGNVEDGFSVKAAGNIEVHGSVGRGALDAEGDIIVHQGIAGKSGSRVHCGGSLYAKFIEHAWVEAGQNVAVTDGIIHSNIDADHMILCQGRRAQIVGGRLRASEEITSKILGSVAGTETSLEVGWDPKSKERLVQLEQSRHGVEKALEECERNIRTLEGILKHQRRLPAEKAQYLKEQSEKRSELLKQLEIAGKEAATISARLASLTTIGKVSASERVYPGVRLSIKSASLVVRTEFKHVTFFQQGGEVRVTKYEAYDEALLKRR